MRKQLSENWRREGGRRVRKQRVKGKKGSKMLFCKTRQNMTVHTVEAGLRFNFKQLHCQTTALPRLVNSIVHLPPTNVNSLEMCSHVLLANQRDH